MIDISRNLPLPVHLHIYASFTALWWSSTEVYDTPTLLIYAATAPVSLCLHVMCLGMVHWVCVSFSLSYMYSALCTCNVIYMCTMLVRTLYMCWSVSQTHSMALNTAGTNSVHM